MHLLTAVSTHRKVFLLLLCQSLAMTGNIILFTVAALIGQALAPDKALTTLPLALLQLATMMATIPASWLMGRVGRQQGFMVGVWVGLAGAGVGWQALSSQSFVLFCLSAILFGSFNSFVGFYRFAAAEVATDSFRSQAIALVVAGGVAAAIVGPQMATWAKDWLSIEFAGVFICIALLQGLSLLVLPLIQMPLPSKAERQQSGRSLGDIMRQPIFRVAVLGSMLGYGVMVLVMTATPLAIVGHAHPFHTAAHVMQWHVLGMFAPSFFTGFLIARWGVLTIMATGGMLSLLCILLNLMGSSVAHFTIALLLLGVGWNFLFIGSTTLLTDAYAPAEKSKTQACHDFLMFGFVTLATLLSGSLYEMVGWQAVNLAGIPMMGVVLVATGWLHGQRDRLSVSQE